MENTNEKILIDAGLSEEQALVYGTLLDRGAQKASALATWTGIKRGLIYKVLEQLETMNLVEKKGGEGTVALFAPLHPSSLINMVEARAKSIMLTKETLTYSLGSLSSKFNLLTGKPNVQFFEGLSAVEHITDDMPTTDTEIRQFLDITDSIEKYKDNTIKSRERRIKLNIKKRMIVTNTEKNQEYVKQAFPLTEYKISTAKNFQSGIQIYDNKVTMLNITTNQTIGIVIEDELIAQTFKNIFDSYWEKI